MFSLNIHGLNLWKIEKGNTVINTFIKILSECSRKPNKLWADEGK